MAADIGIGIVISAVSSLVGGAAGSVGIGWFLRGQFAAAQDRSDKRLAAERERSDERLESVKAAVFAERERNDDRLDAARSAIIERIDAHERLDSERFGRQDLAIMRIEMRQQGKEAAIPPQAATPFEV